MDFPSWIATLSRRAPRLARPGRLSRRYRPMLELLEDEMRRDIVLKGRIRVFGHEQLANLAGHIKDWVKEQSRDPDQK